MADYLCYLFDNEARVLKVDVARHDNDEAALRWAEELSQNLPKTCEMVEVWARDRFIGRRPRMTKHRDESNRNPDAPPT